MSKFAGGSDESEQESEATVQKHTRLHQIKE